MSGKFITGYSTETGHPLEDAVESFLIENMEWILSYDALVEWCIVEKPGEEESRATSCGKNFSAIPPPPSFSMMR